MLYLSSRRQQGICGAKATCCQGHHGCLYLSKECVNPRIVGGGNNNNTVKSVGMVPSGSTRGLGLGPLLVYIYGATSKGPSIQFIFLPCPAGSYVGGTTQLFWLMHCICGFDAKKKSNFCESKPWFYSNTITRQAVASLADIGPSVLYLNLSALNPDKIGFCRASDDWVLFSFLFLIIIFNYEEPNYKRACGASLYTRWDGRPFILERKWANKFMLVDPSRSDQNCHFLGWELCEISMPSTWRCELETSTYLNHI